MQVWPDDQAVLNAAGFAIYSPSGSLYAVAGAQRGLRPNVSANLVGRTAGRYQVQVYNYNQFLPISYQIRLVRGRPEGQMVQSVPSITDVAAEPLAVYFGSGGKGDGISLYEMDPTTGRLTKADLTAAPGPGWLALDATQHNLYAAIGGGKVAGYAIDQRSARLAPINSQLTGTGGGAAHIEVDPYGRYVVTADWGTGSISVLPIGPDGALGEAIQTVRHSGEPGPHPDQTQARAHMARFDPSKRWVLVNDLGLDRTYVYDFDRNAGKVVPNDPPFIQYARGRGPRHMSFHPNGRWIYVINELNSTMTALAWDSSRGVLDELQNVSTLPDGWSGKKWSAQVVVHPSGRFVYGSNRGSGTDSDDIVVFAVNPTSGQLSVVDHTPTLGQVPRNFNLDPAGNFLLAAHQDSDNVVPFSVDWSTGKLTPTGQNIAEKNVICVSFAADLV
jgi:6-phosphogluconolactonase